MKYSTYNDNHYNATVTKDHNKLDVKVGNVENKKRIPGTIFEYGVKSVNGKYGDVVLDAQDVGAIPDTEIIPRFIVDGIEYPITKWEKDIVNNIEGIYLYFKDEHDIEDAIFIPTIGGLETSNAELLSNILGHYVSYTDIQQLTQAQQEIARSNIGVDFSDITNYEILYNKPQINGVELIGNKTSEDLGLISSEDLEEYSKTIDIAGDIQGQGLIVNNAKLDVNIGNGLEFDANNRIQIEDEVIFNCGTSTSVISHYSGGI